MFPFVTGLRRMYVTAAIAVLMLLGAFAGMVHLLVRDRASALQTVITAQGNMALGLERDVLRNLDIYDLSLRAAASGLGLLDGSLGEEARKAVLFNGSMAARHFRSILVADESGVALHDTGASVPRVRNVADRKFFRAHREHDDLGLLVQLRTVSGVDGRPYLSMSRRVTGTDGRFHGIVAGGLDLGYFDEIFSRFALPAGGAIALVGYDGRLVAGFPFREELAGRNVSGGGLVEQASLSDFSSFETRSVIDGVWRVATVRKLGSLPFFLVVGTPSDAVYAEWRQRVGAIGTGMFVFAGTCLLLCAALLRQRARRWAAEQATVAAHEAVRASEQRLRTYVDQLADGIIAIRQREDGHFAFERINAAAAEMIGVRAEDAIGRRPSELWPGPEGEFIEERWRACLESNGPMNVERTREGPEGKRVLRFVLAPVRELPGDGTGPATLLLASVRDVSDTVAMEAKLRQVQRMQAVGQLTAGIAHDFNNMLQAQLGALELLQSDVQDRPRAKKCADLAIAAGKRGSSLTQSLLSFSRQQHLAPRAVPLGPLLEGLREMLSRTLGPRMELEVRVDDGTAAPFVDVAQLEAALLNLALNARDAMPEGGLILFEACGGAGAGPAPHGVAAEDSVLLAVSDRGVGMTPEVASKACEPFFTTKDVGKGSGLGLSMVHGFIQQSGGAMRILSEPGEGTRVELWLPCVAGTPPVESEALPGDEANTGANTGANAGAGRRVLLVDDEPDVLAVTAELLERRGFQVVQAAHGAQALMLLGTEQAFDVLVTDYMMPGIDGGELTRRANGLFPDLPVMVVTGSAESEVLRGLPTHVDVVRKPLQGDVMARRVFHALSRPAGRRAQPAPVRNEEAAAARSLDGHALTDAAPS